MLNQVAKSRPADLLAKRPAAYPRLTVLAFRPFEYVGFYKITDVLSRTISEGFESGSIVIQRIDNLDSVDKSLFSNGRSRGFMPEVVSELRSRGGIEEPLFGERGPKIGIALKFG